MFKIYITFLVTIYSIPSFCQNLEFNRVPLKGNIESYKRFNKIGKLTEEGKIDKKGRPTFWWHEDGEDVIQNKIIYTNDSIYSYSCFCKNIDSLIREFKFKKNLEYDNPENQSWLSCDIEVLNPNGLIVNKFQFEYEGYYSGRTIYTYNDSNKLTAEIIKDKNDSLVETVTVNYDDNGLFSYKLHSLTEDYGGERIEFITDSNNLVKSYKTFRSEQLLSEFTLTIITDSNTQKTIFKSDSFPLGYISKITTFDNKWREVKTVELNSKGIEIERTEKRYFKNGSLKLLSFYEENNLLICHNKFEYDKRNNCKFILVKYLNKKTKKFSKYKYKQLIVYYDKT